MTSEFGSEGERQEQQQQQGARTDLENRYRAIGIPAVNAAAAMTRAKRPAAPRRPSTDMPQFED